MLSGFDAPLANEPEAQPAHAAWSEVLAGKALQNVLEQMQQPEASADSDPGPELHATLRPYQRQGAHWLWFMNRLGLGACLADDMGLGKTIQVLSLLLVLKKTGPREQPPEEASGPSLLVVPASLIANWKAEIQKFAPSLSVVYAHPAETSSQELNQLARDLDSGPAGSGPRDHELFDGHSAGLAQGDGLARWSCWTKRRPSRMPVRNRAARSRGCGAGIASPSAARRLKTGFPTFGRSSIFFARGCLAARRSSQLF